MGKAAADFRTPVFWGHNEDEGVDEDLAQLESLFADARSEFRAMRYEGHLQFDRPRFVPSEGSVRDSWLDILLPFGLAPVGVAASLVLAVVVVFANTGVRVEGFSSHYAYGASVDKPSLTMMGDVSQQVHSSVRNAGVKPRVTFRMPERPVAGNAG